jgi:hypothetical protein
VVELDEGLDVNQHIRAGYSSSSSRDIQH